MRLESTGILIFFVVLLTACTTNTNSGIPDADYYVQQDQTFAIHVGQTAGIVTNAAIVLVRFDIVSSDSRCPVDVQCLDADGNVTAGFAAVQVSVQTALDVQNIEVQMPPEGEVTVDVQEMTLTFSGLQPAAMQGVEIGQLDYLLLASGVQSRDLAVP